MEGYDIRRFFLILLLTCFQILVQKASCSCEGPDGVAPCNTQYGTCAYSEEDIFTCQCRNDDQGARCDDCTPCNPANGRCSLNGDVYTCECKMGYSGSTCNVSVGEIVGFVLLAVLTILILLIVARWRIRKSKHSRNRTDSGLFYNNATYENVVANGDGKVDVISGQMDIATDDIISSEHSNESQSRQTRMDYVNCTLDARHGNKPSYEEIDIEARRQENNKQTYTWIEPRV